jgi:hypothetical protein
MHAMEYLTELIESDLLVQYRKSPKCNAQWRKEEINYYSQEYHSYEISWKEITYGQKMLLGKWWGGG